jgi:Planctomycete cytochrome C
VKRPGFSFCLFAIAAPAFPAHSANREQRFFDNRVAPILTKRCLGCHNRELSNGNISFLDRDSLTKGGRRGPAIVPGKPEQSVVVNSLRHDGELQMPPGPKLPAREIRILTDWIRRGAVWGTKLRTEITAR